MTMNEMLTLQAQMERRNDARRREYIKARSAYETVLTAVKSGTDNPTHTLAVATLVEMVGADALGAMIDAGLIREAGRYGTGARCCVIW